MRIDTSSETWAAIKAECLHMIEFELGKLSSVNCTEKMADQARGSIQACRQLLSLTAARLPESDTSRTDLSGI